MTDRPIILFAHGAGAPSSSAWMRSWAERLGAVGDVIPFDYPYMRAGKRAPDRLPALVAAHRQVHDDARARLGAHRPLLLAGKSMGSRVGCHLAVELPTDAAPAGLICFGYPLRAARTGALRDSVLLALRTPVLFLQGTRDPLCPLDDLAALRPRMTARNDLFLVDEGDHSLELTARALKAQGRTQADWDRDLLAAVRTFILSLGRP